MAAYDVIAREDEQMDATPLLETVMEDGRITENGRISLNDARERTERMLQTLPARVGPLDPAEPSYEVRFSDALRESARELRESRE